MKWWISAGLALVVIGFGAWTYTDTAAVPAPERGFAEPGPKLGRPVLRVEGLTGADPGSTPSQDAARSAPSRSVTVEVFGELGEPL